MCFIPVYPEDVVCLIAVKSVALDFVFDQGLELNVRGMRNIVVIVTERPLRKGISQLYDSPSATSRGIIGSGTLGNRPFDAVGSLSFRIVLNCLALFGHCLLGRGFI